MAPKPAGIDMERNYVAVTLCIDFVSGHYVTSHVVNTIVDADKRLGPHASWLLPLTTASAAALADDMRALAKKLSGFFSRRKLGRHGWAALVGGLRGGKPSLFSLPNFPLDCPFLLSTALSVLVISLVHHYARAALFLSYYAFVCEIHL